MPSFINRAAPKRLIKVGNAALVFGLITSTVAAALLMVTTPASAATVATDSNVSIAWSTTHTDETDPNYSTFENITLSVSQTKNLVNQAITVSWDGARQTSVGEYATNYMQVMQCWGDEKTGPTPEQCQWGAPSTTVSGLMGLNTSSRDLNVGDDPEQDPLLEGDEADPDLLIAPPVENPNRKAYRYPFLSVNGDLASSSTQISKQFDASTTNEISAARTARNGSGEVAFETQTSLEAPQLGCGAAVTAADGTTANRGCWLVVVPRGELNLDASPNDTQSSGRISGSPLSASAWKNRMVVPLSFQSVSASCPLGNAEERIVGSEMIAEAVTSWQPALCGTGTTYGYSLIGDDEARNQIVSSVNGASRLAIVGDPLDKETADDATLAYAPVAESAIVVAYTIDYRLFSDAAAIEKNGLQVQNLTLNARLVAKLLTQSYQLDVPGRGADDPVVSNNPLSIVTDPEFLDLNPEFVGFTGDSAPAGLMTALGSTDANSLVWSWLRADPIAQTFLAGEPDEYGMAINPSYLALSLATDDSVDSFPKADLTLFTTGEVGEPGYGTLDLRPYTNDMHEAAYRTLKADPGSKNSWNPFAQPKAYQSLGAQVPGARFIFSITDAASAARYGLTTAKLVNGAGQAVAPTVTSISKAVAAMPESEDAPGVKVADATVRTSGAYPLALLSYAVVNVCESTESELGDFAKLITYAVGKGQVTGDARGLLPRGYVPLSSAFVNQATTMAAGISDLSAVAATCDKPTPTGTPTATPTPTSTPTATKTPKPTTTTLPTTDPVVVVPVPVETETVVPVIEQPPADPEEVAAIQHTTDQPLSGGRVGLAGALALGIPSMIAGPLLSRRGRKLAKLSDIE
jgi:hypothetical protein